MAKKCELTVEGMHCDACELYIEEIVKQEEGVSAVKAVSETQKLNVEVADESTLKELMLRVNRKIASQGYKISAHEHTHTKRTIKELLLPAFVALLATAIVWAYGTYLEPQYSPSTFTVWSAFLLGFVASISTCMAVVGSIAITFAASVATQNKAKAIAYFHGARIVGFAFLGGVMGILGRYFVINATLNTILEVIISIAMILVGFELLGFKIPRITMPKAISRSMHLFSDKDRLTDGILLGMGTFFLPCGVTQSAQLQALHQGSFLGGALLMGAFALGSFPVLYIISNGSAKIVSMLKNRFLQDILAFVIVFSALTALLGLHG